MRAITFILGDDKQIKPSNTDQGYILRRLLRRVLRHLRLLGINIYNDYLTPKIANVVINLFYKRYPELI